MSSFRYTTIFTRISNIRDSRVKIQSTCEHNSDLVGLWYGDSITLPVCDTIYDSVVSERAASHQYISTHLGSLEVSINDTHRTLLPPLPQEPLQHATSFFDELCEEMDADTTEYEECGQADPWAPTSDSEDSVIFSHCVEPSGTIVIA